MLNNWTWAIAPVYSKETSLFYFFLSDLSGYLKPKSVCVCDLFSDAVGIWGSIVSMVG